jgi:type II secretory pathway component PulM
LHLLAVSSHHDHSRCPSEPPPAAGVLLAAGGASLLLGVVFLGLYRQQLENERAEASLQLNRMLQVTWENAMLKRDVDGLRDIVAKLGTLPGIRDVLILAPSG